MSEATIKRSVARAKALGEDVLRQVVGTSLDKPEQLSALAQLAPQDREALVNLAVSGAKVKATTEVKKQHRAEREADLAGKQRALPDIKFGVILEDLEWDFAVWSRETGMDRHAAKHGLLCRPNRCFAFLRERGLSCAARRSAGPPFECVVERRDFRITKEPGSLLKEMRSSSKYR